MKHEKQNIIRLEYDFNKKQYMEVLNLTYYNHDLSVNDFNGLMVEYNDILMLLINDKLIDVRSGLIECKEGLKQ